MCHKVSPPIRVWSMWLYPLSQQFLRLYVLLILCISFVDKHIAKAEFTLRNKKLPFSVRCFARSSCIISLEYFIQKRVPQRYVFQHFMSVTNRRMRKKYLCDNIFFHFAKQSMNNYWKKGMVVISEYFVWFVKLLWCEKGMVATSIILNAW